MERDKLLERAKEGDQIAVVKLFRLRLYEHDYNLASSSLKNIKFNQDNESVSVYLVSNEPDLSQELVDDIKQWVKELEIEWVKKVDIQNDVHQSQQPSEKPLSKDEIKKELQKQVRNRRGNLQGCGCLLIILSIILAISLIGAPLAGLVFFLGLIILIVGLF